MVIARSDRAWFLLVPLIPSVLVGIFTLYHLLRTHAQRTALNNHVIIILLLTGLILELTETIWYIYVLRTMSVLVPTPAFCQTVTVIGSAGAISFYLLIAWVSIERHILIFHANWLATKTKRFFFHYLSLGACILWPMIFYSVIFFILPCSVPFTYDKRFCARHNCVLNISWISPWESIVHYILPAFITAAFSVALLVRVLYQKYRVRRRIEWRNYKKLAIQLLPLSIIYTILLCPPMALYAAYSAGLPSTVAADYYSDGIFLSYCAILYTPFISILSLPDLKLKCRHILFFWRKPRVDVPVMNALAGGTLRQTAARTPNIR